MKVFRRRYRIREHYGPQSAGPSDWYHLIEYRDWWYPAWRKLRDSEDYIRGFDSVEEAKTVIARMVSVVYVDCNGYETGRANSVPETLLRAYGGEE